MMKRRDFKNNKGIFIKDYVEYYLATGRRPRGYDKNINEIHNNT